jgi:hypothetical protein
MIILAMPVWRFIFVRFTGSKNELNGSVPTSIPGGLFLGAQVGG